MAEQDKAILYLAKDMNSSSRPAPSFASRDLRLKSVELPTLNVAAIMHSTTPAYAGYVHFLSAFLFAASTKRKVYTNNIGYKLKFPAERAQLLPLPPLYVEYDEKTTKAVEVDGWEKDFGAIRNMGKKFSVTVQSPNLDFMRVIAEHDGVNMSALGQDWNVTNPDGMVEFMFAEKILAVFLSIHTYPTFTESNQDIEEARLKDLLVRIDPGAGHVLQIAEGDHVLALSIKGRAEDDMEEEEEEGFKYWSEDIRMSRMVAVAKAGPDDPSINVGPISSVPALPGLAFPYFPGMITPNGHFVSTILERYFLRSFGESQREILECYSRFRKAAPRWSNSESGMQLQHIFYGVDLALKTGARLFVLVENMEYIGFCLLGEGWSISKEGKIFEPVSHEQLLSALAQFQTHDRAVEELASILSKCSLLTRSRKEKVAVTELNNPYAVTEVIRLRKITDGSRKEILSLLPKLYFRQKYYKYIDLDRIKWLLEIASGHGSLEKEVPLYLCAETVFDPSNLVRALAAFGPQAPSLWSLNGDTITIPRTNDVDTATLVDVTKPKDKRTAALTAITVVPKSIKFAIDDMHKVLKEKAIKTAQKERGPRVHRFEKDALQDLWAQLKRCIGDREVQADESEEEPVEDRLSGKKRQREGDDGETSRKRVRNAFE